MKRCAPLRQRLGAIAVVTVTALGLGSCDQGLTGVDGAGLVPQLSVDADCPAGTIGTDECKDSPPTQNQNIKIYYAIDNIVNTEACEPFKTRALTAYMAEEFYIWDGPDTNTTTYYGDQHTSPVRTHLDPRNFDSNRDLMMTIIHEMVHAVSLDYSEYDAELIAEQCLGNLEGW